MRSPSASTTSSPNAYAPPPTYAAYLRRRHAAEIIRTALSGYLDDLNDEPIDAIPTPRGISYLEARRQQHPSDHTTTKP